MNIGLVWAYKWWPLGAGASQKTTLIAGIVIKTSGNAPGIDSAKTTCPHERQAFSGLQSCRAAILHTPAAL